jgi:hypothetical protein
MPLPSTRLPSSKSPRCRPLPLRLTQKHTGDDLYWRQDHDPPPSSAQNYWVQPLQSLGHPSASACWAYPLRC